MRLIFLVATCVALSVALAAQPAVFDTVDVDSTAVDAVDIAGGIVLGIDLSAEDGGVPERGIIFVNDTTCPSPLVAFPLPFNSGGCSPVCMRRPGRQYSGRRYSEPRGCNESKTHSSWRPLWRFSYSSCLASLTTWSGRSW